MCISEKASCLECIKKKKSCGKLLNGHKLPLFQSGNLQAEYSNMSKLR